MKPPIDPSDFNELELPRLKPLPGIYGRPAVPAGSTLVDATETVAESPVEVGDAIAEYLRHQERGEYVDRDAFLARHAAVAGELLEFFANADRLQMLAARDTARSDSNRPPIEIDGYQIIREIDRGGMGVVYEARPVGDGSTVALKMILALSPSADYIARFQREAKIAAALQHPGIVRIHETGQHDGRPYYTMDYVEGCNLAKFVRERPFRPQRAAKCVRRIADAVEYAHSQNVLHRDLKPQNILIDNAGRLRITDFGLARLTEADVRATSTGQVLGSPAYMSPEQATGNSAAIGPQSDVYSLGVILYELLAGRPPFLAATVLETLRQVVEEEPEPPRNLNPLVDRNLEVICLTCLRKKPSHRYQSARELADDLGRYLHGRPIQAKRPLISTSRFRRQVVMVSITTAIAVVLTPLTVYHGSHSNNDETAHAVHSGILSAAESPLESTESPSGLPGTVAPNIRQPNNDLVLPAANAAPAAIVVLGEVEEAKAISGQPVGVGSVVVRVPPEVECDWGSDEIAFVGARNKRVAFSSVESRHNADGSTSVEAMFLFSGTTPLTLDIIAGEHRLATALPLEIKAAPKEHAALLKRWWKSFGSTVPDGGSAETGAIKEYVTDMLSRRLMLPPLPPKTPSDKGTVIEKEFERTVSMLFGFESVRLAMMTDAIEPSREIDQVAVHPLPEPVAVPPVVVPNVPGDVYIEPLANVVPQHCYYLRCGRMRNYLSLRDWMMDWGGSLGDVIAMTSLEADVRNRYEKQLALTLDLPLAESLDAQIADVAVIGTDLCFPTGAGLGVVFEEGPVQPGRLRALLTSERQNIADKSSAIETTVKIAGHEVTLLATDDQTVRSYYVAVGRFHLITNSRFIVSQFLGSVDGSDSIGSLPEFRYARSQLSDAVSYSTLLYVPDAFFRNITSPQFRIELGRREIAAQELAEAKMASAFAKAETKPDATVEELVREKFLAHDFARRPDGSRPMRQGTGWVDSLRGAAGCFLPVLDVNVTAATEAERESYESFRSAYLREWRAMDPVSVAFSRGPSTDRWSANVVLDVAITPYARNEYAFLRNHLAAPQRRHASNSAHDLMGLSACLVGNGSQVDTYVGLRDQAVPFEIVSGKVVRADEWKNSDFADRNWWAAASPHGIESLQLLGSFAASVQQRGEVLQEATTPQASTHEVTPAKLGIVLSPFTASGLAGRTILANCLFPDALGHTLSLLNDLGRLSQIDVVRIGGTSWALMSPSLEVRSAVGNELTFENGSRPAQVVFRLGNIGQSEVCNYVRARSYCEARTVAAGDAHLLNWIGCQWGLEPTEARHRLEEILAAEFVSPTGGDYVLSPTATGARWHGVTWGQPTLQAENKIPHEYRVRFLDWLRGLRVEFTLDQFTLRSRVECNVKRPRHDADLYPLLTNPAVKLWNGNGLVHSQVVKKPR